MVTMLQRGAIRLSPPKTTQRGLPGLLGRDGRAIRQLRHHQRRRPKHVQPWRFGFECERQSRIQAGNEPEEKRRQGEEADDKWGRLGLVLLQADHAGGSAGRRLRRVDYVSDE